MATAGGASRSRTAFSAPAASGRKRHPAGDDIDRTIGPKTRNGNRKKLLVHPRKAEAEPGAEPDADDVPTQAMVSANSR